MAASKKRRVAENTPESSSSSESSDDSDYGMEAEGLSETEVQVDFEARTPDDGDYHGIKNMLQQLFLKARINIGELTNLLIKQDYMGSVLKQSPAEDEDDSDDDSDVFGVFSVIDVTQKKKKKVQCVQQICSYLLDHCRKSASAETLDKFKALLDDAERHVGLLISERFVNIPPQISVPLYEGLGEEMKKAKEEKKLKGFAYFVLISKLHEEKDDRSNNKEIIYANAEEELFDEDAILKFNFSVSDEQNNAVAGRWSNNNGEWKPKRTVMVFPAEKWNVLVTKLKSEISVT